MVAGERSILLRGQLDTRILPDLRIRNWRLEATLTGTLEAYLHKAAALCAIATRRFRA